jgi:ADP-heptose:LPS heptosyltransferase
LLHPVSAVRLLVALQRHTSAVLAIDRWTGRRTGGVGGTRNQGGTSDGIRMPNALKRLELGWRRALLASGHRPFCGECTSTPADLLCLPPAPRILLIRFERIGDVLVSVPVLRALRARHPDARMDLLVSRPNYAVREAVAPFITHLWCYEKTVGSAIQLVRALRRIQYDVVVDLIDHPSTNAQLVIRWCHARAAVGLLHAESGWYTHAAPTLDRATVHPVERIAQLLLPFGIDPATTPLDLEYRLGSEDVVIARASLGLASRPLRFGINLSAREAAHYWGRANYIELIHRVAARDPRFAISVCGLPRDAAEVRQVAAAAGVEAVPATPSLHRFAAIVHEFDLLLTPDTAVVHLAAAWKVPTVALYHIEAGVAPWLPYRTPHRAVADARGIPAIPVERVIEGVEELCREQFPGLT